MEQSNFNGARNDKCYPIFEGMRVFLYRNLNINHLPADKRHPVVYSLRSAVRAQIDGFSTLMPGRVFHHSPHVHLTDCVFDVRAGNETSGHGWKSVRARGAKNVHAGIIGTLVSWDRPFDPQGERISYNPYQNEHFIDADGKHIERADEVWFTSRSDGVGQKSYVTYLGT